MTQFNLICTPWHQAKNNGCQYEAYVCPFILVQSFVLSIHGDSLALPVLGHDEPQGFSQSTSADYQAKINIKHNETFQSTTFMEGPGHIVHCRVTHILYTLLPNTLNTYNI